jgi:hypothetical protein
MYGEKDAKKFLTDFYGPVIEKFKCAILPGDPKDINAQEIARLIDNNSEVWKILTEGGFSADRTAFVAEIRNRSYIGDEETNSLLKTAIGILYSAMGGINGPNINWPPDFEQKLVDLNQALSVANISFNPVNQKFEDFKNGKYVDVFKALVKDEGARKVFSAKDGGLLSAPLETGLKETHYKDGKNVLIPRHTDKKMILARANDRVKEIADNYFGKYVSRGMRLKMPSNARAIFDAITELKIQPQNGLNAVMGKEKEIKDNLEKNAPAAIDDFKYMIEKFKDLSGTTQFKNATRDHRQMKNLVADINQVAADEDRVPAAKNMHFILKGLSYGAWGSSRREAFYDEKNRLDLFKDVKGMNEGFLKWFAVGTNWVANVGAYAVFETLNIGKNMYKGNIAFRKGIDETTSKEAIQHVANNPNLGIANYKADAKAARDAYEDAVRRGDKNSKELKQLENDAKSKELFVAARERLDERNANPRLPGEKMKNKLDQKLQLDAHWDMIDGRQLNELNPGNHSRKEREFFYKAAGAQAAPSKYENLFKQQLQNWNDGMAA